VFDLEAEGTDSIISHKMHISKSKDTSHSEWLSKIHQTNGPLEKREQDAYRG